jgi:hypothetical protein
LFGLVPIREGLPIGELAGGVEKDDGSEVCVVEEVLKGCSIG